MFKVGDVVRVLSWEEIVKRSVPIAGGASRRAFAGGRSMWLFIDAMRVVCGCTFTITAVKPLSDGEYILGYCNQGDLRTEVGPIASYPLTNYMVEHAISKYPTNKGTYVAKS